jgi:hypothetical protein
MTTPTPAKQARLNKTNKVKIGDAMADLIAAHNDLKAKFIALAAKLDADAGVTDTNYSTTCAPTIGTVKDLESR